MYNPDEGCDFQVLGFHYAESHENRNQSESDDEYVSCGLIASNLLKRINAEFSHVTNE